MSTNQSTTTLFKALFQRTIPLLLTQMVITFVFCMLIKDIDLSMGNRGMMDRGDVRTLVSEGGELLLIAILVISVNALFGIAAILLQYSDSKQLRMSFPVRVYLLPQTFRRLATIHMIYGTLAVGTVTLFSAVLAIQNLELPFLAWQPTALAMIIYAVLQTWALIFGGRHRPVAAVVGLLVCGLCFILVMRNEAVITTIKATPALLGIAGALVMSSILLETAIRIGRENRFHAFEGQSDRVSRWTRRKILQAFRSPYWTQAWYEWRTTGWVLPCLVLVILTLYFVAIPLFASMFFVSVNPLYLRGAEFSDRFATHWIEHQEILSSGMLSTAAGAGILTGAYLFLISGEWRQKSTFLRTRPMTTRDLAWVRLTVLFFSTFCATALLMGIFSLINITASIYDDGFDYLFYLRLGYEHVPDPFIVSFVAGTLSIIMWMGIWIVNIALGLGIYGALTFASLLLTFLLIQTSNLSGDSMIFYTIERAPVWLAATLWIVGTLWMYRRVKQDSVMPRGSRTSAGIMWAVCTSAFLYYGLGIHFYADIINEDGRLIQDALVTDITLVESYAVPFTHPVDWVLWAGLSVFPVLPFFSLPYRLNTMRHD